jgi:hypothetical protein
MNYSELSDFEINQRVAKLTGNYGSCEPAFNAVYRSSGTQYNPINRPEQAWPIIAANKISIAWDEPESEWCAFDSFLFGVGTWDMSKEPEIYYHHANPLRAAMVVYLMMQEQKA